MAKTAVINRDRKRRLIVKKYAKKRAELLAIMQNTKVSEESRLRRAASWKRCRAIRARRACETAAR